MTVTTTATRVSYLGNGATTTFSYTFPIPDQDYLVVQTVVNATGVATTIPSTQYSVTGIGTETGGIVTYPLSGSPLATGNTLVIIRDVPFLQTVDFVNQSAYYAEVLEEALDLIVMQVQQINTDSTRQLTLTEGSTDGSGVYDANGNRITNLGTPVETTDAVNKTYVDSIMTAAGNVPSPVLGEVGYYLKATGSGTFGWATVSTAGYLAIANNLSDLASAATARTNLGLGGLAVKTTVATADIDASAVTTAKIADANVTVAKLAFTGTPSSSTVARGDGTWATLGQAPTSWVSFTGVAGVGITIQKSQNISSITRVVEGRYEVNFTSAYADAYYLMAGATRGISPYYSPIVGYDWNTAQTASKCAVMTSIMSTYYGGIPCDALYTSLVWYPG